MLVHWWRVTVVLLLRGSLLLTVVLAHKRVSWSRTVSRRFCCSPGNTAVAEAAGSRIQTEEGSCSWAGEDCAECQCRSRCRGSCVCSGRDGWGVVRIVAALLILGLRRTVASSVVARIL